MTCINSYNWANSIQEEFNNKRLYPNQEILLAFLRKVGARISQPPPVRSTTLRFFPFDSGERVLDY
jgi:hypothetical protein